MKWTNSALSTMQDCGIRYDFTYLQRIYAASTPPQIRGSAVHEAVRLSAKRKIDTGSLPSVEEVRDTARDAFDLLSQEDVRFTAEDLADGTTRTAVLGRQKDAAVALAGLHRLEIAPRVNPIAFERRITVKPRDMDVELEGTIDLIDGQAHGEVVRDEKTRDKSPSRDEADESQQFSMYGLLRLSERMQQEPERSPEELLPVGYALDVLVCTPKRGDLKPVTLHTTRDLTDIHAIVGRLNRAIDAVTKGVFLPANPSWWGCSERWCSHWDRCPFGARGRGRRPEA